MMQLPAWGTRHPWLSGIGACVVVGLAAGWLFNGPPQASGLRQERDAWSLPDKDVLNRYHAAYFQSLTRSLAWREPPGARVAGGPGDVGAGPVGWKLVGIVTSPEFQALVLPRGGKTQRLVVGDKLPNGERLERITHDWIEYSSENCLRRRVLFPVPGEFMANLKTCKPAVGTHPPGASARETHE